MSAIIPFEFYGDRGEVILFAHANAYPPAAYGRFFNHLTREVRVLAVRHRPLWPGSRPEAFGGWRQIAGDLLDFLRQRNIPQIIAVGHSLGAVASMFAANQEPDRFRGLVLIEPVFMPPATLTLRRLVPASLMRRHPLVKVALNRRREWPTREEAFAHFRRKEVFSRWPDETLQEFVDRGLLENPQKGSVVLAYPREWEARIYATVPQVWGDIPRIVQPTLGIRGEMSDTITDGVWQKWQKEQPTAEFVEMPGVGHMLPMEQPAETARRVLAFIRDLPQPAPDRPSETDLVE